MYHDYEIANAVGVDFRADINSAFAAVVTQNAANSAPAVTFGNMQWYDQTLQRMNRRDSANTAWQSERSIPAAATTWYVSSGGSDTVNDGLTSAAAWKTMSMALTHIANYVDTGATGPHIIQLLNGVYSGGIVLPNFPGQSGIWLQGNVASPASCQILGGGGQCIQVNGQYPGGDWTIQGFKFVNSAGHHINIANGRANIGRNEYGFASGNHLEFRGLAALAGIATSYSITGSAACHLNVSQGARVTWSSFTSVVFSGNPGFSSAFCFVQHAAYLSIAATLATVNSANGKRFDVRALGIIDTAATAAQTLLPGTVAGDVRSGGIYV